MGFPSPEMPMGCHRGYRIENMTSKAVKVILTIVLEECKHVRVLGNKDYTGAERISVEGFAGGPHVRVRWKPFRDYKSGEQKALVRRMEITEDQYNFFTSGKSDTIAYVHRRSAKDNWKRMGSRARLEYFLDTLAEGKPYTYEILEEKSK